MPFLGYKTYYRIVGTASKDKMPLLLLHGGPGSTHNYFEVLDRVAEETGRQVMLMVAVRQCQISALGARGGAFCMSMGGCRCAAGWRKDTVELNLPSGVLNGSC